MRGRTALGLRFSEKRWLAAYRRVIRQVFRTVPFYRERWALVSRDPVLADEVQRRRHDLVPLAPVLVGDCLWKQVAESGSGSMRFDEFGE